QGGSGSPSPGRRYQPVAVVVVDYRNGGIERGVVRTVDNVAIPDVAHREDILWGEVEVHLGGYVVPSLVVPGVEAVASGVEAIAHGRIVRRGWHLREQILDGRIDG